MSRMTGWPWQCCLRRQSPLQTATEASLTLRKHKTSECGWSVYTHRHTCTLIYIHTHSHTYKHAYTVYTHTHAHPDIAICSWLDMYMKHQVSISHTHTHTHSNMHTHTHRCMHTHSLTFMRICIHADIHSQPHSHTCMHTHTRIKLVHTEYSSRGWQEETWERTCLTPSLPEDADVSVGSAWRLLQDIHPSMP